MILKVLFIVASLRKGGAETQLIKLARYLKSNQYKVKIIVLKPINDFNIDFNAQGLDVVFLKEWSKKPFLNIYNLFNIVKTFNAKVVIAFMFVSIIFARFLKMWFKFYLISSIRTPVISKKWELLFKITQAWDDVVVYNSNKSKLNFEQNMIIKKNGLVINNSISIPEIKELESSRSLEEPFVWICMAHFVPAKDYITLFKAIALIKHREFRVDILGNLFDQTWPFQIIKDLQIEKHVRLLGLKTDTIPFLRKSDAFVLSSFLEGMPNAVLEAMAYNKPIVASRVDGINELLESVDCGFLFEQGNEKSLAEKMVQIMEMSDQQRYILGRNGRNHVKQHFSEEQVMPHWHSLIDLKTENKAIHFYEILKE